MSYVFLTGPFAYKLKKPVRSHLLDYSTPQARQAACRTEVALNRSLAPGVYLAAVPVVVAEGRIRVDQPGTVIDWLVKMRRLSPSRMLDACIQRGAVRDDDVDRLAAILSDFYARTDPRPLSASDYPVRLGSDIEAKQQSLAQPRYRIRLDDVDAAVAEQSRWLDRNRVLLEERAPRLVDAHGDLRPEHICLEDPRPLVIDRLDFSADLRRLDPVSELAFLGLECRRLGASSLGDRLIAGYAASSADRPPPTLIRFYQSYHALVRAAVAVWHIDDHRLDDHARWRVRASWYLNAARNLRGPDS